MTSVLTAKPIYPANAHLTRHVIEVYDPTTDTYIPFAGGVFRVSICEAADGTDPINGLVDLLMAPVPGAVGSYYRQLNGTELAALEPFVGQVVYQIVAGGAYDDYRVVTPMIVTAPRYAQ
jgi:hypothetical protein